MFKLFFIDMSFQFKDGEYGLIVKPMKYRALFVKECSIQENNDIESISKEILSIQGLTQAYLEAYSDFLNPVLGEMSQVVKIGPISKYLVKYAQQPVPQKKVS
jgi:hypothetical protein